MKGILTLSNGSTLKFSQANSGSDVAVVWGGTTPQINLPSGSATIWSIRNNTNLFKVEIRSGISTNGILTLNTNANSSMHISSAISGSGSLKKNGGYELNLYGNDSYKGKFEIAQGTVNLYGDKTNATGGYEITGPSVVTFKNSSTIKLPGGNTTTPSNASATGPLTIGTSSSTGTTSVTLESNTNYTITNASQRIFLTNKEGKVTLNVAGTITNAGSVAMWTNSNGDVELNVSGSVSNAGTLTMGRRSIMNLNSGGTWTQAGDVSVSGNGGYGTTLNVNSGSAFTYNGTNAIAINPGANGGGGFINIAGTLQTKAGFDVTTEVTGTGRGNITLQSGGTLKAGGNIADLLVEGASSADTPILTIGTGGGKIDTNGNNVTLDTHGYSDNFTGSGTLTKAGTGTLTLSGANSFTGSTTISGGTLKLTDDSTLGSGTLNIASESTLDVSRSSKLDMSNVTSLTGSGTIDVYSGLIFSGTSDYNFSTFSGTINCNSNLEGILEIGGSADLSNATINLLMPSARNINIDCTKHDSTLKIGTLNGVAGTKIAIVGNPTTGDIASLTIGQGDFAGVIGKKTGYGSQYDQIKLIKNTSGTLILSGVNTYTQGTDIQAGTLKLTGDGTLGTGSVSVGENGTLEFSYADNKTLSDTVSGISGSGGITKSGAGTLTVSSALNSFSGKTTISEGTLKLSGNGTLGSGETSIAEVATLELAGNAMLSNKLSGSGQVIKSGTGTTTMLLGSNSYQGGTTISGGTLKLTDSGTLGTGAVALNGGTLEIANSPTITSITGAGKLMIDSGKTTISQSSQIGEVLLKDSTTLHLNSASTIGKLNSSTPITTEPTAEQLTKLATLEADNAITIQEASEFYGVIKADGQTVTINTKSSDAVKLYSPNSLNKSTGNFVASSGRLDMKGYYEGSLEVKGGSTFSPGNSIGTLNMDGTVTIAPNATLLVEMDSTGMDKIVFNDSTTQLTFGEGSVIELNTINGYTPTLGGDITEQLFTSIPGIKDALEINPLTGKPDATLSSYYYQVNYNDDGSISIGVNPNAVPEPSTWALLILGTFGLMWLRKRK